MDDLGIPNWVQLIVFGAIVIELTRLSVKVRARQIGIRDDPRSTYEQRAKAEKTLRRQLWFAPFMVAGSLFVIAMYIARIAHSQP